MRLHSRYTLCLCFRAIESQQQLHQQQQLTGHFQFARGPSPQNAVIFHLHPFVGVGIVNNVAALFCCAAVLSCVGEVGVSYLHTPTTSSAMVVVCGSGGHTGAPCSRLTSSLVPHRQQRTNVSQKINNEKRRSFRQLRHKEALFFN